MTIKIFSIKITIFKVEKLQKQSLNFDRQQAKKESAEIINSESFQALKEKALKARQNRQGV